MASIDAFSEWALRAPAPLHPVRASLRRLRRSPPSAGRTDRKERTLTLLAVVLLHLALFLALRAAMRMPAIPVRADPAPLLISFVEPQAVPAPMRSIAAPSPLPRTTSSPAWRTSPSPERATAKPPASAPRPPVVAPGDAQPPSLQLYSIDGRLKLQPLPSLPSQPRDLLAHRPASSMLPGAPGAHSPDFHVQPGIAPRDVVNRGGRILGDLIANAAGVENRFDSNGAMNFAPDRGVRTSDRWSDPCQDIAQDMVNLDDAKTREMAEAHYQALCEGH